MLIDQLHLLTPTPVLAQTITSGSLEIAGELHQDAMQIEHSLVRGSDLSDDYFSKRNDNIVELPLDPHQSTATQHTGQKTFLEMGYRKKIKKKPTQGGRIYINSSLKKY